ncbi:Protein CASP [Neolecta irregularis DAH-3]|uniref:Protein CASP n=1 Tax=Neolecta irregularis (strain DAH-3) TaxID=1198029 RepID=A0A1U7LRG5_NEOID|nr:Protein CASP [Neolecta irregularis DAH-3]|eukprot:OLL25111.1 Protein CASP [Neolecta irregularis DAH-3]
MPESSGNSFQRALAVWRNVNLSTLQKQLHSQGSEIIEGQKESLLKRKDLSQKTKDFRKLSEEEKTGNIKGLLKAYQSEIDALTKRSKVSESAFLSLHNLLANAPDPYPLLELMLDQAIAFDETEHLAKENAELKKQIVSQSDVADLERRLAKAQEDVVALSREKEHAKEVEMRALFEEKEKNWAEREAELHRQVNEARDLVRDMAASHEATQARLSAHDKKTDEGLIGRLAELDIAASDLERANLRIVQVERRNEELCSEIAALRSGKGTGAEVKAEKFQETLKVLEEDYHNLTRVLERTNLERRIESEKLQKMIASLEKDSSRKGEDLNTLRNRESWISSKQDLYFAISNTQLIEFSTIEEEISENPSTEETLRTSLEKLLLSTNKKLNNDLTLLRVSRSDLEENLLNLQTDLDLANRELSDQKQLAAKLEEDLSRIQDRRPPTLGAPSVIGTTRHSRSIRQSSPADSIINSREDSLSGVLEKPDTSILPIITQQRDRFRSRNSELEDELRQQFATISALRSEVQQLQKDNLQLYERSRYLGDYRRGDLAITVGEGSQLERYRNQYEKSVNPFENFRGRVVFFVHSLADSLRKQLESCDR